MITLVVFCVNWYNFITPPPQRGFYTLLKSYCLVNTNGLRTRVLKVVKVDYKYC